MDLLHVRLLGGLEVRHGSVLLSLPTSRRTRALLAYLVGTTTPQSRAALCDLLWDGPDDPRASLRWSLSKLRDVVDVGGVLRLESERDRVRFNPNACEVDVQRLRSLLASDGAVHAATPGPATLDTTPLEVLEESAALLQAEFLDGIDLPACYRFHHWCIAERQHYGALRRRVLEALMSRLAQTPERALQYAHQLIDADPLAEAAHASLVQLLAAARRYPDAERHYCWARDLLRREVSIVPGGPLDDAIHRSRRAQGTAAAALQVPAVEQAAVGQPAVGQPPVERAGSAVAPVLIGRAAECAAIDEALTGTGRGVLLFFTGEPGIGKTTLLGRYAAGAAAAGRLVIRGRCFEAEMVRPYGLWLDSLRGIPTDGIDDAIVAQAAPLLAARAVEGGDRERLFEAAAALLQGLAARRPIALVLDDLQWIDESSAALLHFLVRTLVAEGAVQFAGAARPAEAYDNPSARNLVQSLPDAAPMRRFDLAPLTQSEAIALLGATPLDAASAWRQAGGNPLYLLELARAAQGAIPGTVSRVASVAASSAAPSSASTVSSSIDRLIHHNLGSVDDESRELLAWAAAMGREVRPEALAAAAALPIGAVLTRLERLERHRLLIPTGQGHFDFAHDLVRQALYRSLSPPRRIAIHRQFVRTLGASGIDVDAAADAALQGEVVHHAELAGDRLSAARACLAAGEHCLRLFANAQAAAVAERGLSHVAVLDSGGQRVRLEIGLLRLRVRASAGAGGGGGSRMPALAAQIERAAAAAEALALPEEAAAGWEILAYWRQQVGDSGSTHEATLAAARMAGRASAAARCLQLANSGRCVIEIEADPAGGRELIRQAATLAAELDLEVMELEWARGLIARADGDLPAARAGLARAVALARLAENHWREFECMVWLATVELEQGCWDEVRRHVEAIGAAAVRMGESQAPFAQALGALACWRQGEGAAENAEATLMSSLQALRERDDKAHLGYALNQAAALALEQGRAVTAEAWAAEALAAARAVRRPTEVAVATSLVAMARWAAAGGRPDAAAGDVASRSGAHRRAAGACPVPWPVSGRPSARAAAACELAAAQLISTPVTTAAR